MWPDGEKAVHLGLSSARKTHADCAGTGKTVPVGPVGGTAKTRRGPGEGRVGLCVPLCTSGLRVGVVVTSLSLGRNGSEVSQGLEGAWQECWPVGELTGSLGVQPAGRGARLGADPGTAQSWSPTAL